MTRALAAAVGTAGARTADPATVLRRCVLLTLATGVVELAGGFFTGALTLLGDAGHMATDGLALGLAYVAVHLARRRGHAQGAAPPGAPGAEGAHAHTHRPEAWAALANALLLLGLVAGLSAEAVSRLADPPPLLAGPAIGVAAVGLLVNLVVLRWLRTVRPTLNVRAAHWHVLGDLLGSLSALASGVLALIGVWPGADPVLTLGLAALLLVSVVRLTREAWSALRPLPPS